MVGFEVAAVGDNCVDKYMPPVGLSTVGGNALNVGVQLRARGLRSAYFGAVGDDADGRRTRAVLESNGLDASHVQTRGLVTAFTQIGIDADGDRRFLFEEFGACRGYRPSPGEEAALARARHVHIGWLDDGGALGRYLRGAGVSVSQDLAVNPDAGDVAIAFLSAGPDLARAEALMRDALERGARIAVATCGKAGSVAADGRRRAQAGIKDIPVVDTTGAGDSFIAGFLAAHLAGEDLAVCLAAGRDAAAETCAHLGGFPQTPLPL